MMRIAFVSSLVLLSAAPVASAQQTVDAGLTRIDSLVAAGELGEARTRLAAWLEANPPGPGGPGRGTQAHALFLQGRLARDWTGAEDAYLSVVLGYPTSQQAPHALLLLGKGLLAVASINAPSTAAIRAVSYLERLSNDYPGHPLHDEAQLWLARAHADAGNTRQACSALRRALDGGAEQNLRREMRAEWDSMCDSDDTRTQAPVRTRPDSAVRAGQEPPPPPVVQRDTARVLEREAAPSTAGPYTVQVAAMRSREGARTIASQLDELGFDARIVDLEGSGLVRVRVDFFRTERDAESVAARIRQHGFETVVTNDVARERRQP